MTSFLSNFFSKHTKELPEQRELNDRKAGLLVLQAEVAQRELDLATIRSELQSFKTYYYQRIGSFYRVRDTLNSEIAELLLALNPNDEDCVAAVEEASAQEQSTYEEIDSVVVEEFQTSLDDEVAQILILLEPTFQEPFKVSTDLKTTYDLAILKIDLDNVINDDDKIYRNEIIEKINLAYQSTDLNTIADLVNDFQTETKAKAFKQAKEKIKAKIEKYTQTSKALKTDFSEEALINDVLVEDIVFEPVDNLKTTYRKAVMLIHPDRAINDNDRAYRNEIMAKINVAYEKMDLEAITELVNEFKSVGSIGDDLGRELILLIRQETALKERLIAIDIEISALQDNQLAEFKTLCEIETAAGNDLIEITANELRTDINTSKARIVELRQMIADRTSEREKAIIMSGQTSTALQTEQKNSHTGHIHGTDRGEFVRSKSELVISNVLHALGLKYYYERKIEGHNTGGTMLPDFVFISQNNEVLVWEHLGMLTKPEYKERWDVKRRWYEDNDFVQGVNFFTSRDAPDGSLDSQVIRKIAQLVKTLL